jgi:hypothetical protein
MSQQLVLDRRRRRGRRAGDGTGFELPPWYELDENGFPIVGGIAKPAGARDRASHGLRRPGDDPRARAARRDAGRVRPECCHASGPRPPSISPNAGGGDGWWRWRGEDIVDIPLGAAAAPRARVCRRELYRTAEVFFG